MPDGFSVTLTGVEALNAKLKGLSHDLKHKGGKSALRKAAQLVAIAAADEWRKLDDKETGRSIADNIVEQGVTPTGRASNKFRGVRFGTRRFKATGDLMFRIGVQGTAVIEKKPDKSKGAKTPHWRLLELGTETMPAKGIMRSALTNNAQKATDTFITAWSKSIDRVLKKQAKGK